MLSPTLAVLHAQSAILMEVKQVLLSMNSALIDIKSEQRDLLTYVSALLRDLLSMGETLASTITSKAQDTLAGLIESIKLLRQESTVLDENKKLKAVRSSIFTHTIHPLTAMTDHLPPLLYTTNTPCSLMLLILLFVFFFLER